MVKKEFCDRCGKEILDSKDDEFSEMFEKISNKFDEINKIVLTPRLCSSCGKGYEKIITKANKEIQEFLEEKPEGRKKKFGLF